MAITEKIKTIDNKIKQNKVQYDLDRETAEMSALSSGNVSEYEFLNDRDVLPEKRLVRKSRKNRKICKSSVRQRIKSTD